MRSAVYESKIKLKQSFCAAAWVGFIKSIGVLSA